MEAIALPNYCVERKLGTGSYASVWLARRIDEGSPGGGRREQNASHVAIKAISREKLTQKLQESLESEISILRDFRHPNLVALVEIHKRPEHIYIVLEYMPGGDLQKLIRSRRRLTEATARRFMRDLAAGLEFLWSKNLIHRDIKPQNLLLTSRHDASAVLKIADFGFARHLETAALAETLCGSPLYMAPEILSFKRYDAKADLWSVGTVLFEMVAGEPPFQGRDHRELLENIQKRTLRLPQDVTVSMDCLKLLQTLLKRNPISRVSFEDFLAAPFIDHHHHNPAMADDEDEGQNPPPLDEEEEDDEHQYADHDRTRQEEKEEEEEENAPAPATGAPVEEGRIIEALTAGFGGGGGAALRDSATDDPPVHARAGDATAATSHIAGGAVSSSLEASVSHRRSPSSSRTSSFEEKGGAEDASSRCSASPTPSQSAAATSPRSGIFMGSGGGGRRRHMMLIEDKPTAPPSALSYAFRDSEPPNIFRDEPPALPLAPPKVAPALGGLLTPPGSSSSQLLLEAKAASDHFGSDEFVVVEHYAFGARSASSNTSTSTTHRGDYHHHHHHHHHHANQQTPTTLAAAAAATTAHRRRGAAGLSFQGGSVDGALCCALVLAHVADHIVRYQERDAAGALSVYVLALRAAEAAICVARAQAAPVQNSYSHGDNLSPPTNHPSWARTRHGATAATTHLDVLTSQYTVILHRAEDARSRVLADHQGAQPAPDMTCDRAEDIVYAHATKAARLGAARESLGDLANARRKYADAARCLQALNALEHHHHLDQQQQQQQQQQRNPDARDLKKRFSMDRLEGLVHKALERLKLFIL